MNTSQLLNPISMPLNAVSLIEASAGTGKTHTMASLYLRLLLQAGKNNFPYPLNVEQILVVTFTDMATQELRARIRERIYLAKQQLIKYAQTKDKQVFGSDDFLAELADHIEDVQLAIHRLTLAEQNMDLAAISTIHSFCQKMLMQYAFNSGIHFNLTLVKDEYDLLQRLTNEFWRENFYSLPLNLTKLIHKHLVSPFSLLNKIQSQLSVEQLKLAHLSAKEIGENLHDFLFRVTKEMSHAVYTLKQAWLEYEQDIQTLIFSRLNSLNATSYKEDKVRGWFGLFSQWANSTDNTFIPEELINYFTQTAILAKLKKGQAPIEHPFFQLLEDTLNNELQSLNLMGKILLYHSVQAIRTKLFTYKLNHSEKGFNDLLRLVKETLYSSQGIEFAKLIRHQYPFAMIDEFQDTDIQQYQIFSKIYISQETSAVENGFIMIGDPKQSIYKFRGADIFTYFNASEQAAYRFTLEENWRSGQDLIDSVNRLFDFKPHPFLYENIHFLPARVGSQKPSFLLNGKIEPAMRAYISDSSDALALADGCAASIQYWLKCAADNRATIADVPLKAKDIAVLVSTGMQAEMIQNSLLKLGISSVYLSDKSNVFDSNLAWDLYHILYACFDPLREKNILNAISSQLLTFTAAEIYQIKQNETLWEHWIERFIHYQKIWKEQGVLVMLHNFLFEQGINEKLLQQNNGERRLTDVLHLIELLQQASRLNNTEAALLHWFEKQIQGKDRLEENIRLESERELVKIVTIHKSKGLAYDLVWLPFVATPMNNQENAIETYYDPDEKTIFWDIDNHHKEMRYQEKMAEAIRLLYVALTRAKYQVVMGLPAVFDKKWSALLHCLTQGEYGIETNYKKVELGAFNIINAFNERFQHPAIHVASMQELQKTEPLFLPLEKTQLSVTECHANIERDWVISSFSQLLENHKWLRAKGALMEQDTTSDMNVVFDGAKDYDSNTDVATYDENIPIITASSYPEGYSPHDFPRGTQVGTMLHRYFEKNDFAQLAKMEKIEQLCHSLMLDSDWHLPLQKWFTAIKQTPLLEAMGDQAFCFGDISWQNRLHELQFYLKVNQKFDMRQFNALLKKHHKLPYSPLESYSFKGMLRGFIDLVFRHNGRYYIVDYKSNFLGESAVSYNETNIQQAMLNSHYDWQYLLYSVALHRYLTRRDPHYNYDQHFGGVIYTFLRGMDGVTSQGVFFDKPSKALIEGLEELF